MRSEAHEAIKAGHLRAMRSDEADLSGALSPARLGNQHGRNEMTRAQEKRDSWTVTFQHQGVHYEYQSRVSCSARNVYYRGYFFVNGEQKTVRAFKALTA